MTLFFKMSRVNTELRSREDRSFHEKCLALKKLAKGTPQEPECPEEQYLVYEEDDGDIHFREHAFGTLRVIVKLTSTGLYSGRPSTYKAKVSMDSMLFRIGNVGWWDVIALAVYFLTFTISFKGELGTIVYLPYSLYKIRKHRLAITRPAD